MNPVSILAILGQLASVAAELNTFLDSIRANDPDTWAKLSAAYPEALDALRNAHKAP